MYLRMGNLGTQLITSPTPEWRTFLNNELVAILAKDKWVNEDVDFLSKEAGEILLDTYKTIYAAQVKDGPVEEKDEKDDEDKEKSKTDEKPVEEEAIVDVGPAEEKPAPKPEASMVKSDEGVTKDVPAGATTLPAPTPGPDDHSPQAMGTDIGNASPDEVSSDDIPGQFAELIHKLTELVEKLHEGKSSPETAAPLIDEMHSVAQQFKAERLIYIARKQLDAGIDCTAALDELDKVAGNIKPVQMNDIHEDDDEKIKPLEDITALLQAADRLASQGIDVSDVIEQLAYDDGVEGQDEQDKQRKGKVYKKMLGKGQGEDEEARRPFKEAAINKAAGIFDNLPPSPKAKAEPCTEDGHFFVHPTVGASCTCGSYSMNSSDRDGLLNVSKKPDFRQAELNKAVAHLAERGIDVSDIIEQIAAFDPFTGVESPDKPEQSWKPLEPGQKLPSDNLTPYGWIGPEGSFYHVQGHGGHSQTVKKLIDNGLANDYKDVENRFVHVSPTRMVLPPKLTSKHADTLSDYYGHVFDNKPGFDTFNKYDKEHVKNTLDNALTQLDNTHGLTANLKELQRLLKVANSNGKCASCGQDTDKHAPGCATQMNVQNQKNNYTQKGAPRKIGPKSTTPKLPDALNPMKSRANLSKVASHIEMCEVPMKDIEMDPDKDYNLLDNYQLNKVLHSYLRLFVFPSLSNFTIEEITREGNTLNVKTLVFDNQIAHE